jgi:hypothetical protein
MKFTLYNSALCTIKTVPRQGHFTELDTPCRPKLQFRLDVRRGVVQIRHERRHTFYRRGWIRRPSVVYIARTSQRPTQRTTDRQTRTKVRKYIPFREDVLGRQGHVRRETVSARALPPCLGCPAAQYFKQSCRGLGVVLASEVAHDGSDVVGLGGTS